jgi:hypothetical protein
MLKLAAAARWPAVSTVAAAASGQKSRTLAWQDPPFNIRRQRKIAPQQDTASRRRKDSA